MICDLTKMMRQGMKGKRKKKKENEKEKEGTNDERKTGGKKNMDTWSHQPYVQYAIV